MFKEVDNLKAEQEERSRRGYIARKIMLMENASGFLKGGRALEKLKSSADLFPGLPVIIKTL